MPESARATGYAHNPRLEQNSQTHPTREISAGATHPAIGQDSVIQEGGSENVMEIHVRCGSVPVVGGALRVLRGLRPRLAR